MTKDIQSKIFSEILFQLAWLLLGEDFLNSFILKQNTTVVKTWVWHVHKVIHTRIFFAAFFVIAKKEKQLKDVYKNGMPKETIHKMVYYIPVKMDIYICYR